MLSKQRLSMTVHPIGIKLLTTPDSAGQQWMGGAQHHERDKYIGAQWR